MNRNDDYRHTSRIMMSSIKNSSVHETINKNRGCENTNTSIECQNRQWMFSYLSNHNGGVVCKEN